MCSRARFALSVLAASAVAAVPAATETFEVCPGAYPTIQSAVDAATTGDTVRICHGTYAEAVIVDDKLLEIRSAMGTVIVESLTWIYDAPPATTIGTLSGITFTGDVSFELTSCVLDVTMCTFEGATHVSTVASWDDPGRLRFTGVDFVGPVGASASGPDNVHDFIVCTFAGGLDAASEGFGAFVSGCTFDGCHVSLTGETGTLEDCTITGGGATLEDRFLGLTATGNVITGCDVGLRLIGEVDAVDNEIRGCTVGIHTTGDPWTPAFVTIAENRVVDCATGILAEDVDAVAVERNVVLRGDVGIHVYTSPGHVSSARIAHNTIDGVSLDGVRLDVDPDDVERVEGNLVTNGGAGVVVLRAGDLQTPPACNDVWGNAANWLGTTDPTGTGGNISMDPVFCLATPDDRRIDPASPCADGHHPGGASCGTIGALEPCFVLATDLDPVSPAIVPLRVIGTPGEPPLRFEWAMALADGARLEIFDASGARVAAVPIPGNATAVGWNGRTDGGAPAGPGVYWARVGGEASPSVRRFVIVR